MDCNGQEGGCVDACDVGRQRLGKQVGTGSKTRESDAGRSDGSGGNQTASIAGGEELAFAVPATEPSRGYSMDNEFRWKAKPQRHLGFTDFASSKFPAHRQQLRTGGAMNGTIHTAPTA